MIALGIAALYWRLLGGPPHLIIVAALPNEHSAQLATTGTHNEMYRLAGYYFYFLNRNDIEGAGSILLKSKEAVSRTCMVEYYTTHDGEPHLVGPEMCQGVSVQ
jgi:hypothetical protein